MTDTRDEPARPRAPARWMRRCAIGVGVLAALFVLAWLAVPPIVRAQVESRATEALGRRTTLEAVAFDPFRLRLTLEGLAIAGLGDAPPLATVDVIEADLSTASIWHRAPVLDALKLTRPAITLGRDRDGRPSVQDLLDRGASGPAGPPPRFSLNNIEIDGGSIRLDDARVGRRVAIEALEVGIPFLSTLPYETDVRVTPRMRGKLDGAAFALEGTTVPFAERREAALDVDLDALPLPDYVAYLPSKWPLGLASGALTTRLKVVFVDAGPNDRRLELRGEARVDRPALVRADGSAVLAADRVAVALERVDVFGRDARLASVAIDAPRVDLRRDADGRLELARLAAGAASPSPATASPAWTLRVDRAMIAGGAVGLSDAGSGFRTDLADVALEATGLSSVGGERARVKASFVSADRIASFTTDAEIDVVARSASGRFALAKFSLGLLFPYYKDALAVDVQQGSLDYASSFTLDGDGRLTLAGGEAAVANLRYAFPGVRDPLGRVPRLELAGIDVDVPARKVAIASASARGAVFRLVREADGTLELARLVRTTARTGTAASEATWSYAVGRFALNGVSIDAEDRAVTPVARFVVRDLAVTATNFSNARAAESGLTLSARVGERGRLAFRGKLANNPFALDGEIEAAGFALVSAKSYFEPRVEVVVTGGTLDARGRLAIATPASGPVRARWQGSVAIADFASLDRPTASDLARWRRLALDGMRVSTSPPDVAIDRVALEDFQARVILHPDATLNVARLLAPGRADAALSPASAPAAATAPATPSGPLPIAIGRIELARGGVDFSDLFVRPNYRANLTDVSGTITALSATGAGDVAIDARVDRTAPVEIRGRVQPFAEKFSLDLAARATDIELPPMTPYAVKYAGYGIERGKLTFDVRYRVEDRRLSAENRLVLDQLVFGDRVESPTATKLPVLLAVALLKDRHGVIDIRLPISGSLDDPKFSVGGLIVQVIVNLITKAVTAPFALLAAIGGGGEELSVIAFAPGSAAVGGDGAKRVETLGRALSDRPALKLDIAGRADPAADREALRRASVETALRREKLKSLAGSGADGAAAAVDAITIAPDERARWVAAAYRASSIPDRPRNFIGMLKDLPPAEMEAMLYANAQVDDAALAALANARAQAVKDALARTGVGAERLFLVVPKAAPSAAGAPPARVDLALR